MGQLRAATSADAPDAIRVPVESTKVALHGSNWTAADIAIDISHSNFWDDSKMIDMVRDAYSARAVEYTEHFGSMRAVHPSDRQLVATWAGDIEGQVIDAGCGPGQWTNFLSELGISAQGVDLVPEFIERARAAYPGIPFRVGSLNDLDVDTSSVDGVLAWYSLIHYEPSSIRIPLMEFSRVLKPGGALLIGFFEGPVVERFDHAVFPAYRWHAKALCEELAAAGFEVTETHVRTAAGQRSHGAIVAQLGESFL